MRTGIVLVLATACTVQATSSGGAEAALAEWTEELGNAFAQQAVHLMLRVVNMEFMGSVREQVSVNMSTTLDDTIHVSGITYGELTRWKEVIEGHSAFWGEYLQETARLWGQVDAAELYPRVAESAQREAASGLARDWRYVAVTAYRAHHGQSTSFGGGAGFGFQIMCDSDVIFTMGGGLGAGAGGRVETNGNGGAGGGAGFQIPSGLGASSDAVNIGGGGGGCLLPPWNQSFHGSADTDAHGSFALAQRQAIQLVKDCEARDGKASLLGGGGGGHGFATSGGIAFGGGFSFELKAAFRGGEVSLTDLAVGVGEASGQHVPGKAIGAAAQECRKQCIPGGSEDGSRIYQCYCGCTKTKFSALGLPWAAKIQCQ